MPTQAQIEANRRNAQLSTGPKTPEGKARASVNALKHGIRARAVIDQLHCTSLLHEDAQEFADLLQAFVDEYQPVGPSEEACIEDIAISHWRLRRVTTAEIGHIAKHQQTILAGPDCDDPALRAISALPESDVLHKLNRYENSIRRHLERAIAMLQTLQSDRLLSGVGSDEFGSLPAFYTKAPDSTTLTRKNLANEPISPQVPDEGGSELSPASTLILSELFPSSWHKQTQSSKRKPGKGRRK